MTVAGSKIAKEGLAVMRVAVMRGAERFAVRCVRFTWTPREAMRRWDS